MDTAPTSINSIDPMVNCVSVTDRYGRWFLSLSTRLNYYLCVFVTIIDEFFVSSNGDIVEMMGTAATYLPGAVTAQESHGSCAVVGFNSNKPWGAGGIDLGREILCKVSSNLSVSQSCQPKPNPRIDRPNPSESEQDLSCALHGVATRRRACRGGEEFMHCRKAKAY